MLFASSLNVELVYIILKSVIAFSKINFDDASEFHQTNGKITIADESTYVNTVININNIKIKNTKEWDSSMLNKQLTATKKPMVLSSGLKVTFYQRKLFQEVFQEYMPDIDTIKDSLSPSLNREQIFKSGEGAGSSGSFFFFSHDSMFIIKTMTKSEVKAFVPIIPQYIEHFRKNPQTLIAKIFGVFTVKTKQTGMIHFFIMENTMRLKNKKNLKYVFDLKGSTVDREVKGETKNSTTLKDVNFLKVKRAIPDLTTL